MRSKHSIYALALLVLAAGGGAAWAGGPQRIVSTNLCTDEYLFRLAPRERIAALSVLAGDRHPQVSTIAAEVGGIALIHPNAEDVLAEQPDLVLLYQGANPRLKAQLRAAGMPLFELPWAGTLEEIRVATRQIAGRLGVAPRGEALLSQMDHVLATARASAAHPPVRTVIYEPNGYASSGALGEALMGAAGLANAAPGLLHTRQGAIPVEEIVAMAPELLIIDAAPEGAPALADAPLTHPALAALRGHTRIVHADLKAMLCAGPWSAQAAMQFVHFGRLARASSQR